MIFVLPETKGISLERMDKLFGEVDYVAAGEFEAEERVEKAEASALNHNAHEQAHGASDRKNAANTVQPVDIH